MGALPIDKIERRLRAAAGLPPFEGVRSREESRSFIARPGCSARVQIDHIGGQLAGGISIGLRSLTPDAAEAVLRFLAARNEPNSALMVAAADRVG